ncbi:MAG: IPT/TIG domain-containing protein [Bryobacteraceae bacterium]
MRVLRCLLILAVACSAFGQTYTINTIAGGVLPVNVQGTSASIGTAQGVAVDSSGNVFIVAPNYNLVLRLGATSGELTVAAGNGTAGFSGDNGPAASAQLAQPYGVAVDTAGNLYIVDGGNNRVRKVSNGVITTVAGNGGSNFSGDNGPATSAQLVPTSVAVDSAGDLLVGDVSYSSGVIRKVSNGVITTVAGGGTGCTQQTDTVGDGCPATSAALNSPQGVAVDSAGNLYIADFGNNRVRKVSNGVIATVAGTGTAGYNGDNVTATSAKLYMPWGVAVDSAGNLYIADSVNGRIRKVSNGVITTVAGNGTYGVSGDNGPATSAGLDGPTGVAVDSAGNLYIVDYERIRKVSNAVIATIAGNGTGFGGDNGPATNAQLDLPAGVALDSAGNLYIADTNNNRIREVSSGVITTVAGNGSPGYSGNGNPATSAELRNPQGVFVVPAGNLYIADTGNQAIREVSNGVINQRVGPGSGCGHETDSVGDGCAGFYGVYDNPAGVAVDSAASVYIADTDHCRIREVSNASGTTTVAGNGTCGFSGDNGPATSAELLNPRGVALDSSGNLYIADYDHVRIVSGGVITTFAGGGTTLGDGGPATSAELDGAQGVALDSAGNLYIADSDRVRKVSGGVITTIAGGGETLGDNGPATSAEVNAAGVAVDAHGNIYVADSSNDRVRLLTPSSGASCTYTVSPSPLTFTASASTLVASIQTASGCAWAVQNLPAWITFAGNALNSGPGSVTLVATSNTGPARSGTVSIAGFTVPVTQAQAVGWVPPALTAGSVANGATYIAGGLVAGSWAQVKGASLSTVKRVWDASDFAGLGNKLPTNLSGVQVNVNNLPAALYYVSPTQINFQVPTGISGTVSVQVVDDGVASNSVTAAAVAHSPGIFPIIANGNNYAACVFWSDGMYAGDPSIGPSFRNAKPGDIVQMYATGLVAAPAGVLPSTLTVSGVTVTIGSVTVPASYAGLVAVGEFQINFTVPQQFAGMAAGNYPISIEVDGVSSPANIGTDPPAPVVLPIQP